MFLVHRAVFGSVSREVQLFLLPERVRVCGNILLLEIFRRITVNVAPGLREFAQRRMRLFGNADSLYVLNDAREVIRDRLDPRLVQRCQLDLFFVQQLLFRGEITGNTNGYTGQKHGGNHDRADLSGHTQRRQPQPGARSRRYSRLIVFDSGLFFPSLKHLIRKPLTDKTR